MLPASISRDVGCQTDPPQGRSVGTQLSFRTLHSHYRSEGLECCRLQITFALLMPCHKTFTFVTAVQATVSLLLCKDFGMSTDPFIAPLPILSSTPIKAPFKRPHLEQQEEEEDSLEGSSIMASQGLDTTYDPEDLVTALTESTVMS